MKEVSDFANRLKEQRKKLGFTQAQIAEMCGISSRMWGDYERGKYFPRNENLIAIEKAGIDIQYVMYGEHKQTAFRQPENHLTEQEQEWLMLLKQLTPTARKSVLDFAKYQLADQGKKETAEDHQIQRYYGT